MSTPVEYEKLLARYDALREAVQDEVDRGAIRPEGAIRLRRLLGSRRETVDALVSPDAAAQALEMAEEIEAFVERLLPVEAEQRLLDAAARWRVAAGLTPAGKCRCPGPQSSSKRCSGACRC